MNEVISSVLLEITMKILILVAISDRQVFRFRIYGILSILQNETSELMLITRSLILSIPSIQSEIRNPKSEESQIPNLYVISAEYLTRCN